MDQKFHGDDKKTENLDFETWLPPHGHNPAKSRNSKKMHDSFLSIGNFMLMIDNRFTRFQLPVATRNFFLLLGIKT
jgi:hypothetical protein